MKNYLLVLLLIFSITSFSQNQIGLDIEGETLTDSFGGSISLSSDGSIVAIGAHFNNGNGENSGHVRIYKNLNDVWIQVVPDIEGENEGDYLGLSVNLSPDGSIIAIGGNGFVRVYNLSTVLSSNTFTFYQFSIYPNPTSNQFTIQLKEGIQFKKASIYNQLGQFISSTTSKSMNVESLSQGIYFVEITTDKGRSTKKLIID